MPRSLLATKRKLTLLAVFHQRGALDGSFHGFFRAKTTPQRYKGANCKLAIAKALRGGYIKRQANGEQIFAFNPFYIAGISQSTGFYLSTSSDVWTARLLIIALGPAPPLIARFLVDSANLAGSTDGPENTVAICAPEIKPPPRTTTPLAFVYAAPAPAAAHFGSLITNPLTNRFENNPNFGQKIPQQQIVGQMASTVAIFIARSPAARLHVI